jgi:hypothetical protein
MDRLKHIKVWIKRIRHRKGYGVQSPFAFDFITGVIYEKGAYYDYPNLETLYKQMKKENKVQFSKRVDQLLFRIANFHQPDVIVDFGGPSKDAYLYLSAGCKHAKVHVLHPTDDGLLKLDKLLQEHQDKRILVNLAQGTHTARAIDVVIPYIKDGFLLVEHDIYSTPAVKEQWNTYKKHEKVVLTFDLYDLGISMFDKRYNKQDYIVNF